MGDGVNSRSEIQRYGALYGWQKLTPLRENAKPDNRDIYYLPNTQRQVDVRFRSDGHIHFLEFTNEYSNVVQPIHQTCDLAITELLRPTDVGMDL